MRLSITHTTTYRYDEPVAYGLHELRLIPQSGPSQMVESWDTQIAAGRRQVRFSRVGCYRDRRRRHRYRRHHRHRRRGRT